MVAPGFINLHWHGKDPHSDYYEAMDGVTSTFELEVGVTDVDRWYDERAGRMPINYGAAIGHAPSRMAVMNDPGDFLPAGDAARKPATDAEMREIAQRVEQGLKRGAVGVGFGLAYTPAASRWEILQMFRLAAQYKATTFVHIRGASSAGSSDREEGLLEAIALSAVSSAPVHIAHINEQRAAIHRAHARHHPGGARTRCDVSTECYPYTARSATRIESLLRCVDGQARGGVSQAAVAATGERLTKETFSSTKLGGLVLIHPTPRM